MSLINFLLLNDEPDDDVGELDPAPAATDKAVSRRGDLKARHRVLQADARAPPSYERLMLSGEERNSSRSPNPHDGHRFDRGRDVHC